MAMDPSQLKRLGEWLKEKEANRVCGACGGGRWQIVPNINFMPEMQGGQMRVGSGFPVVTVGDMALWMPRVVRLVAVRMSLSRLKALM